MQVLFGALFRRFGRRRGGRLFVSFAFPLEEEAGEVEQILPRLLPLVIAQRSSCLRFDAATSCSFALLAIK